LQHVYYFLICRRAGIFALLKDWDFLIAEGGLVGLETGYSLCYCQR
jgi:hypothetical protein